VLDTYKVATTAGLYGSDAGIREERGAIFAAIVPLPDPATSFPELLRHLGDTANILVLRPGVQDGDVLADKFPCVVAKEIVLCMVRVDYESFFACDNNAFTHALEDGQCERDGIEGRDKVGVAGHASEAAHGRKTPNVH